MTAALHAGRRAGILRAAERLAPAKAAASAFLARAVALAAVNAHGLLARGGHDRALVEEQARGLLPMAA